MPWIEIIGYCGSVLVAISLMMSNIWKLRWINFFGASIFAVYGLLTKTYPVLALNSFIALTDVFYIIQMARKKDFFTLSEVPKGSYHFLNRFLNFFEEDIRKFFPEFNWQQISDPNCVFVLRNLVPVGLFIYEPSTNGRAEIHLDYVRPEYRDLKTAHYLYREHSQSLKDNGIHTFFTHSSVKAHRSYLQKLGFQTAPDNRNLFTKAV